MINDAVNATSRNLRSYSFIEGIGRKDELEIPSEVLREAIANAVVHREYHPYFQGQPVTVDVTQTGSKYRIQVAYGEAKPLIISQMDNLDAAIAPSCSSYKPPL